MKKAQMFTIDFILGLVGFIFLLLIAIKILLTIIPTGAYEGLYRNNIYISDQLVGDGYPKNWTSSSLIIPGLADEYRLNLTKLAAFDALDYNQTKTFFHVTNEYLFFFQDNNGILNISSCLHGYPLAHHPVTCEPNLSSIQYQNLVKTQRLLAHNATLVQLVVYSWN